LPLPCTNVTLCDLWQHDCQCLRHRRYELILLQDLIPSVKIIRERFWRL
jgi:hypothetical protein